MFSWSSSKLCWYHLWAMAVFILRERERECKREEEFEHIGVEYWSSFHSFVLGVSEGGFKTKDKAHIKWESL